MNRESIGATLPRGTAPAALSSKWNDPGGLSDPIPKGLGHLSPLPLETVSLWLTVSSGNSGGERKSAYLFPALPNKTERHTTLSLLLLVVLPSVL